MPPTYAVERCAPAAVRADLERLWDANLTLESHPADKFAWLYAEAPRRPDAVFVLRADGAAVGTAGVGVRPFQLGADAGQFLRRRMSNTALRAVPSPDVCSAWALAPAAARLSCVAHRREPTSAPSAPSTIAAARVRPSAMPPAASSRVSGECAASQSAGTRP